MNRRWFGLILILGALVAVIGVARDRTEAETPTFSVSANGWMPFAPPVGGLTETWFCPGVPATGIDDVEGEVVIANRTDGRLVGTVLLIGTEGGEDRLGLDIDPWSTATVELHTMLPGDFVGAVVEIDGGGGLVEQRALSPAGNSSTPCTNATSDTWYLADGFTVDGSLNQVILTNPFEQTVVANLEFATREGSRRPDSYRGLTVPPRSVRVIDLGAPGAGAQNEPILAVTVEASLGRLVVGRAQTFLGGGRSGQQIALASPALRDQWWFADGEKGPGIDERFSIYNPTSDDIEVDVILLGIESPVVLDPIVVEARNVVTFDTSQQADLPEGRHATVFAEAQSNPAIVVERALTRTADEVSGTSVVAGATPRQDGYVARSWYVGVGPDEPAEAALVLYNADNSDGLVSVSTVGSSGPVPVEGLTDLVLPRASMLTIDLTDPLTLGRELLIESTSRVFVEESFPTGRGDTRSASWAIPAG